MDTLTSVIEVADAVDALDLTRLHDGLSNLDEVRQTIELLLDAYNSHSGTSREVLQKQCVMRSLAEVLESVHDRYTGTADASAAPVACTFWRHQLDSSVAANSPTDPQWAFTPDDSLLLSMFLNETATTTNATTLAYWSRAVTVLFPCATAIVFPSADSVGVSGDKSAADEDAAAETTRASLESELHSLREIVAKRFTTSVDSLRRVTLYDHARRSLQSSVWALLGALAGCVSASTGERIVEELEAAVEGMLQPLNRALQEPLTGSHSRTANIASGGRTGKKTSPTLLSSLLQEVEDVLWAISHIAVTSFSSKRRQLSCSLEPLCSRAAAFIVEALLKFAQQYISLQQQRQMEFMEKEGAGSGGDGRSGSRGAKKDVFRVYHVQRSVQRVLSVGLQLRRVTCPVSKGGMAIDVSLVSEVAYSGLQAAVSAFGGAVFVTDPVNGAIAMENLTEHLVEAAAAEDDNARLSAWRDESSDAGRLRECRRVLAPPHHLTTSSGEAGGGEKDYDLFNDEEGDTLLGHREAYLKTSLGPVTASALVDMVMLTVSHMDFLSEDAIQELHRRGLEKMQLVAAYEAQREEVEKLRQMERQGVEAIAAGKLIEHVKDSAALHMRGMQILRKVSARSRLERAAFSSVLGAYQHVRGEAEARIRLTQALISRCLVQLPPSLADSAMDELLLHLRRELTRAQAQKEAAASGTSTVNPNADVGSLFLASSYYQLTLQVLFMYYATQAPMHERSATWNSGLLLGGGAAAAHGEDYGAGLEDAGPHAGGDLIQTEADFSIEVDSPIAFLYDDDVHRASQDVGRKRSREEPEGGGGAGEEDTVAGARTITGEQDFSFLNDTVAAPSTYSHMLCRVLELIRTSRLNVILLDVLLQAPLLTRYVWYHLYKHFCLSADKASCVIGMWLLRNLAVRRPVYRTCAVNILLQLCLSTHDYARRFAIKEIDQLLSAITSQGTPVLDRTAEGQLLRYAKKQLFAIPAYQCSSSSRLKRPQDSSDAANANDSAVATGETGEATAKDRARMSGVLNRRLGLFLMLCARQPRELFPALLEVFQQCVERGNIMMMQLLPENADVRRMTQHLVKTDASNFVASVMPLLRKRCREARPLVQSMLWAVREQLSVMAQEANTAANTMATSSDGIDAALQYSSAASLEVLRNISNAVLGHAKAMYELSGIPIGRSASSVLLLDIRYVAPFLSFLSAKELRQTYLGAFLLFLQAQLQFQRHYHNAFHRLSAAERTYMLEATELRAFQIQTLREVLVKCPVNFQDGVPRGLSRVDFFVYLHRAPQESHSRLASSMLSNPLHGGALGGATGGVLDGMHNGERALAGAVTEKEKQELPPISVGTTKEVVNLCFELTRTFDNTTVEKLYGPSEVQKALQQLMYPPPIPSQLMATVLQAATLFLRSRYVEFINFVVQTVLTPLERASVWDTDPQLWKGVILFTERYYRECSNFLVNLPDKVLTQALREHPQLCEYFKEEHGNNASFMHILGNL